MKTIFCLLGYLACVVIPPTIHPSIAMQTWLWWMILVGVFSVIIHSHICKKEVIAEMHRINK